MATPLSDGPEESATHTTKQTVATAEGLAKNIHNLYQITRLL